MCSKIVQTIDDQHRHQRTERADQRSRRHPDQPKRRRDHNLRQQVISKIVTDQAMGDFHEPPGQRWQLVVAELPFLSVGQCFDQIEGQICIEQGRESRPHQGVNAQNSGQRPLRGFEDPGQHGMTTGRRRRLSGPQWLQLPANKAAVSRYHNRLRVARSRALVNIGIRLSDSLALDGIALAQPVGPG